MKTYRTVIKFYGPSDCVYSIDKHTKFNDAISWCKINFANEEFSYRWNTCEDDNRQWIYLYFTNAEDATLFKLKFGSLTNKY